jgi:hypothetical protein
MTSVLLTVFPVIVVLLGFLIGGIAAGIVISL